MHKQFAQKVEELRRLIENQRSASSAVASARFLLAVSGGMDSMCLLHLFSELIEPEEYAVAHCNFSLRGDESDSDQALVEEYAQSLGIRCFVQRFDTVGYSQKNAVSIEMAARDLRYGWFEEICEEYGYDAVVVAHNANDNAETLVLNLLRGTGLNGLHGMSEVSCNRSTLPIFRPLLEFTRKQIEGYVLANRVPYRHDSSNFESDYKRNKIRNEIFPVFERINPSFVRTLNREISYFAEAGSIVDEWCAQQMQSVVSDTSEIPLQISIPRLLAVTHWRYLLYYILSPYGFNQQTLASVESLLASNRTISGKRFESATHLLLTGRENLSVISRMSENTTEQVKEPLCGNILSEQPSCMAVHGPGMYNMDGVRFKVEVVERTSDMNLKQPSGTLILDADKMEFPFVCRHWRMGDWFVPFGMRGKKKISDLFADLKYDTLAKEASIMIVDVKTEGLAEEQHVAGVLGVRIDDRYKVAPETCSILRISLNI